MLLLLISKVANLVSWERLTDDNFFLKLKFKLVIDRLDKLTVVKSFCGLRSKTVILVMLD